LARKLEFLQKDPFKMTQKFVFFTKPITKISAGIAAINSISADAPHFTKLSIACTTGLF
jgi:hypothetical protein